MAQKKNLYPALETRMILVTGTLHCFCGIFEDNNQKYRTSPCLIKSNWTIFELHIILLLLYSARRMKTLIVNVLLWFWFKTLKKKQSTETFQRLHRSLFRLHLKTSTWAIWQQSSWLQHQVLSSSSCPHLVAPLTVPSFPSLTAHPSSSPPSVLYVEESLGE